MKVSNSQRNCIYPEKMFVISHRIFTERGGFYHKNTADQHIFTNKGNVNLSDELQMMQKNTFLTIIL